MIINFPTGLYKSILPTNGESGNVTYTISTQEPPSQFINVIKLPIAEEFKMAPDKVFTDEERREQLGELVFTVVNSNRSLPGSNIKAFEVGEILAFENLTQIEEINTINTPKSIEIRHDTNLLDLELVGLNSTEVEEITKLSQKKYTELESSFAQKRTEIENIDVNIRENQKQINEMIKTIKAIIELFGISYEQSIGSEFVDNEIFLKLMGNLKMLEIDRDNLISERNGAAIEVENIYQSLMRVSELVR